MVDTFLGWARVMQFQSPLALNYVDLFCGPGVYDDGTPSTPVELFEAIARDNTLAAITHMFFNDRKAKYVEKLRNVLLANPYYGSVTNPPQFQVGAVTDEMVQDLRRRRPRPYTFAFIDPCGYSGLSRSLIETMLADFGCDVMFFFSYQAIRRVLSNPNSVLRSHIEALLGPERVRELVKYVREDPRRLDLRELERRILRALRESMTELDGQTVLTFAFRRPSGLASHHLAFVSKHPRGFEKAKQAMAPASSELYGGEIPSFQYQVPEVNTPLIEDDDRPSLEKLARHLVRTCGGRSVSVKEAFDSIPGEPYIESNVRAALKLLIQLHGGTLVDQSGVTAAMRGSTFPRGSKVVVPIRLRRWL